MRNGWRVLAFDVLVPLGALGAVLMIGVFLDWPLWWVSAASILCLLIVQAVIINVVLWRRDAVTMGTDDDGALLRVISVGLVASALAAAVAIGYTHWTEPDRTMTRDADEVVRVATTVSEATATFSPQDPTSAIDRAAALMAPEQARAFKSNFGRSIEDLARENISARAQTISAGLEALGPGAASVTVVLRATQSAPAHPPSRAVLSLRVSLVHQGGKWLVVDVAPIDAS